MTSTPADGDSLLGRVLDNKYRIDRLLGRGGFGSVYLARHLLLDHPCAIKVLHRSILADSNAVARFQQEARATVKIRHPNAIAVMDFGITQDSVVYFVMEYFPGVSLRDVLRQAGPMPLPRASRILECVAGALAAAHVQGILHRDVKPDNIMLAARPDGGDDVKVVDFGIAKLLDSPRGAQPLTLAGTILGTPYYLSPEQVNGFELDPRSDLYALGIVTYEMLTGSVPFNAPTPIAVAMKHVSEHPPSLAGRVAGLTPQVEAVLLRALAKHPQDRYPTTTAFAQDFAAAVTASGEGPPPTAPVPPAPPVAHTTYTTPVSTPRASPTTAMPPPETPSARAYSTGSGAPTTREDFVPPPQPPPARDERTAAIPWQTEQTVTLPAPDVPAAPAPPAQPAPLAHLHETSPQARPPAPPAAPRPPAPTPAVPARGPNLAAIAVGLGLLAILGAGVLAAALYWTQTGRSRAPDRPAAISLPEPVAAPSAPAAPLFRIAINVYDAEGTKRVVAAPAGAVTLGRDEQYVQFDVDALAAGYLYVVDAASGEFKTQLTAQPSPGDNVRTNALASGRTILFPGTGKAIAVPQPRTFSVVFSPVPLETPAFLGEPAKKVLTPAEADEWRAFLATANRSTPEIDPARKRTVVAGPVSKDAPRPTIFEIAIEVR
jgi:serine/threonine-protein kinase